jgi:hemerythrin superfamily protein
MKTKKKAAKHAPLTKSGAKTAAGKLGSALASTASFAAGVARETAEVIRDLASSVTKSTTLGPSPGATDLLVHQHRLVEQLFERLESSKKGFDGTLRALADDLAAHISIEERLFYPAVRKVNTDLILEGLEEHAMGRFALRRLLATRASDKELKARLEALKELMTNHHHEEEHDLFPAVRRLMSDAALGKLGAKMHALFDANLKRGHEAVLATFDDDLRKPVRARTSRRVS